LSFYSKVYNFVVLPVLLGGFHVLSPFVSKIQKGLRERKGLVDRVAAFRKLIGEKPVILFHCASAGEFESLRPLSREFDRGRYSLVVSYFSPSARAVTERSNEFDFIDCSPIDDIAHVRAYYDALRPSVVCITKHDVWPNFIWESKARSIPSFLISGNFHQRSLKLLPGARGFHRAVYSAFTEVMTVSEEDSKRAAILCGSRNRIFTMGDTRYDRVTQRAERAAEFPNELAEFCRGKLVLVAGSTHTDDENLLFPVIKKLTAAVPNLVSIIVPHDPSPAATRRIQATAREFGMSICDLDQWSKATDERSMIVNKSGILADLYRFGTIAYVGGGFGKGVHSVLEPMVHGLPVITGPNISVSNEAIQAKQAELLVTVTGRNQVSEILETWLTHEEFLHQLQASARKFVLDRSGATTQIASRIQHALTGKP
jgi:3-deoxy-D-manno-octulosonic-acid transferase